MNAPETQTDKQPVISPQELAILGGGHVAYIRELNAEKASELIDAMPALPPYTKLYGLFAADGTCMSITETHDAALADAWQHDLEAVSVH